MSDQFQFPLEIFDQIKTFFSLAELQTVYAAHQGLMHRVWYIKTLCGEYALKEINSTVLACQSLTLLTLEQTQMIARQMQREFIPTQVALSHQNTVQAIIEGRHFMVLSWSQGKNIAENDLSVGQAKKIGQLLADIHSLQLPADDFPPPIWQFSADSKLLQLLPSEIQQELPGWNEQAVAAQQRLNKNLLLTHRDIDPKNLIQNEKDPRKLWLIDWDYAGPMNPELELYITAMNCSGIARNKFDLALFQAVVQGYDYKEDFSQDVQWAYVGYLLDWIKFNLCRSLKSAADAKLFYSEVENSLRVIKESRVVALNSAD